MNTTLVTTFEGINIYVDTDGYFTATRAGKKKARGAWKIQEIKSLIREDQNASTQLVDPKVDLRIFIDGVVQDVTYVGVRRHDTETYNAGHLFKVGDSYTNLEVVRVIKDASPKSQLDSLEDAANLLRIAQRTYDAKLKMTTTKVRVPYTYHDAHTKEANKDAASFVQKLQMGQR